MRLDEMQHILGISNENFARYQESGLVPVKESYDRKDLEDLELVTILDSTHEEAQEIKKFLRDISDDTKYRILKKARYSYYEDIYRQNDEVKVEENKRWKAKQTHQ